MSFFDLDFIFFRGKNVGKVIAKYGKKPPKLPFLRGKRHVEEANKNQ